MKLFLIVEWIDDSPTVNGAKYYESKEEAVEAALHLEKLNKKHLNSQKDDGWRIKMIAIVFWFLMFVALVFEINT